MVMMMVVMMMMMAMVVVVMAIFTMAIKGVQGDVAKEKAAIVDVRAVVVVMQLIYTYVCRLWCNASHDISAYCMSYIVYRTLYGVQYVHYVHGVQLYTA